MVDTLQTTAESPDEFEVMEMIAEAALDARYGPLVAKVETYNQVEQTVSCTPVVRLIVDGELQRPLTLQDVPVEWPQSAQASLTLPLGAGDFGTLEVLMVDHDRFFAAGTTTLGPQTRRRSALTDVIFRPGVRSSASPLPPDAVSVNGAVLRSAPFGFLGSSTAAFFIAVDSKVLAELTAIITGFNSHTHPTGAGPTGTPTVPLPGAGSVSSTKWKIDS